MSYFYHLKLVVMKLISLISLFLILISCQFNTKNDKFDTNVVSTEARLMLENYHKDINQYGLMSEFKYLDSTKNFFWIPPGYKTPLDFDSVRSILTKTSKSLKTVFFKMEDLKLHPLSKKYVNYSATIEGHIVDTSGNKSEVSIIESGILVKREDGWKLFSGQSANNN